jgi:hypothetical protein
MQKQYSLKCKIELVVPTTWRRPNWSTLRWKTTTRRPLRLLQKQATSRRAMSKPCERHDAIFCAAAFYSTNVQLMNIRLGFQNKQNGACRPPLSPTVPNLRLKFVRFGVLWSIVARFWSFPDSYFLFDFYHARATMNFPNGPIFFIQYA